MSGGWRASVLYWNYCLTRPWLLLAGKASAGLQFWKVLDQKLGSTYFCCWIFHTQRRGTFHDLTYPTLESSLVVGRDIEPSLPLPSSVELSYVVWGSEGSLLDFQNRAAFPPNNQLIFLSSSLKMFTYFLVRKLRITCYHWIQLSLTRNSDHQDRSSPL